MKNGVWGHIAIISVVFMMPRVALAQDIWEMAESEEYGKKAGGMVARGLVNAVTSPVDLIVQTVESTQEGPPLFGTLTGLATGLGCTAIRASSGILDVATFWVPGFNGFKVSRSYSNCLEAEYTQARYTPVREQQPEVIQVQAQQPQVVVVQEPAPQPVVVKSQPAANPLDYVKKGGASDPMDYAKKGTADGSYVK